jgi:uncharacterized protein (DUF1778 family)
MKASVSIQVRVSPDQWRLLRRVAKRHAKSLAALVRETAVAVAAECDVRDTSLGAAATIIGQSASWRSTGPL